MTNKTAGDPIAAYRELRPQYEQFTLKLRRLLQDLLEANQVEYHLVEARTKEVDSFAEKIREAHKQYTNPIEEVTDLVGLRVIVYYPDDVDKVVELVKKEFDIDWKDSADKRDLLKPDQFGYLSVHYVVTLGPSRRRLAEWAMFRNLKAEIQIRTVLQHSWAAISHALQYKSKADIPSKLRRRLFRLSGLLELADQEFATLRDESYNLRTGVQESLRVSEELDLEINSISLGEYLPKSPHLLHLENLGKALGFNLEAPDFMPEVPEKETELVSAIADICSMTGITTIKELDQLLVSARGWDEKYLRKQKGDPTKKWYVSPMFLLLLILIGVGVKDIPDDYLEGVGWSPEIAERVLRIAREYGGKG